MKFHGLQAKEKKNALVYLVHFFLYLMNKLVLLSVLNSLSNDEDSMWCLSDAIERSITGKTFTFDQPAYVEHVSCEFYLIITYPNGHSLTTPEMGSFFGYVPAGTTITTMYNANMDGVYYNLIKVEASSSK